MKLLTMVGLLLSFNVWANLHQAPPHLNLSRNQKAVFVDFKTAKTIIQYDLSKNKAMAKTTILFEQTEKGSPIFDLVNEPTTLMINGEAATSTSTSMDSVSNVRYINKTLEVGSHVLYVENEITKNLSWSSDYVKSAFWMSDLSDRRYLEQYLPTNLEYDQYQMNFEVSISGTEQEHVLYTNGDIKELAKNHWSVSYRDIYTASSVFFHLTKKGLIPELKKTYQSIDGRVIPITVYTSQDTNRFMKLTLEYLAELERDYGPFPHDKVIVYGAGSGGMEYCGATITSLSALGHELTHSYFARGIMPAHGNSGWVDEAVASWRDSSYPSYSEWRLSRTEMAGHSTYRRTTDRNAYTKGMRFIGFLHNKFKETESFKVFLKSFFEMRKFKPFKTPEFQKAVEDYYNVSLKDEFNKYVYGKTGIDQQAKHDHDHGENKYHPKRSEQELLDLL